MRFQRQFIPLENSSSNRTGEVLRCEKLKRTHEDERWVGRKLLLWSWQNIKLFGAENKGFSSARWDEFNFFTEKILRPVVTPAS